MGVHQAKPVTVHLDLFVGVYLTLTDSLRSHYRADTVAKRINRPTLGSAQPTETRTTGWGHLKATENLKPNRNHHPKPNRNPTPKMSLTLSRISLD